MRRTSFVLLGFAAATPTALAFSAPLVSRVAGVAHSPSTRTVTPGWRSGGGCCSSNRWAIREGRHLRSFEGGDFPSDVGDDAGSSAVPAVLSDDNPDLRETMKREILSIAATSNRCGYPTQHRCCLMYVLFGLWRKPRKSLLDVLSIFFHDSAVSASLLVPGCWVDWISIHGAVEHRTR